MSNREIFKQQKWFQLVCCKYLNIYSQMASTWISTQSNCASSVINHSTLMVTYKRLTHSSTTVHWKCVEVNDCNYESKVKRHPICHFIFKKTPQGIHELLPNTKCKLVFKYWSVPQIKAMWKWAGFTHACYEAWHPHLQQLM